MSLSYAELEATRQSAGASILAILGVGPDVIVGLCVERSDRDGGGVVGDIKGGEVRICPWILTIRPSVWPSCLSMRRLQFC